MPCPDQQRKPVETTRFRTDRRHDSTAHPNETMLHDARRQDKLHAITPTEPSADEPSAGDFPLCCQPCPQPAAARCRALGMAESRSGAWPAASPRTTRRSASRAGTCVVPRPSRAVRPTRSRYVQGLHRLWRAGRRAPGRRAGHPCERGKSPRSSPQSARRNPHCGRHHQGTLPAPAHSRLTRARPHIGRLPQRRVPDAERSRECFHVQA